MYVITENSTTTLQQFVPEKKFDYLSEPPGRLIFLGLKELNEGIELLDAHVIMLLDVALS